MTDTKTTDHARKRMRQRAVTQTLVRLIETFGEYRYQKGGASLAYIPNKQLDDLRHAIEKAKSVCAVYGSDDRLVTVMHRTRAVNTTDYVA